MTSRDYRVVAQGIREALPELTIAQGRTALVVALSIAQTLLHQSETFSEILFLRECGFKQRWDGEWIIPEGE